MDSTVQAKAASLQCSRGNDVFGNPQCPRLSAVPVWSYVGAGREDFPAFPHKPYDIQKDFMESLYRTLEKGGVGLFESPTGKLSATRDPFDM